MKKLRIKKLKEWIGIMSLCIFTFFSCTFTGDINNSTEIQFGGIYYYEDEANGHTNYFRFYSDWNVISLTSIGKYNNNVLKNWIIEYYSDAIGKYDINNGNITFTIISANENIEYSGKIKKNSLILSSYSKINNYEDKNVKYTYKKIR
jgi:hypothetical protein